MEFNVESLTRLASQAYIANASRAFGDEGAEAIKTLLNAVRSIFQRCPPESLDGTLTVLVGINASPLKPI